MLLVLVLLRGVVSVQNNRENNSHKKKMQEYTLQDVAKHNTGAGRMRGGTSVDVCVCVSVCGRM
jgi:hypothetical protein